MRILIVYFGDSSKPLLRCVEPVLKSLLANSYEVVIRDQDTLTDHLYDQQSPFFNIPENKKVKQLC